MASGIEIPETPEESAYYTFNRGIAHGQVRECQYYSEVEGRARRCFVYTPAEYETSPERKYPVLYLQHGMGKMNVAGMNKGTWPIFWTDKLRVEM